MSVRFLYIVTTAGAVVVGFLLVVLVVVLLEAVTVLVNVTAGATVDVGFAEVFAAVTVTVRV